VEDKSESVVLAVVKAGPRRYALVVDRVLASAEIVVKPIHSRLRGLNYFSGATILGDGRVALILNPQGLASAAHVRFGEDTERQLEVVAPQSRHESQSVLLVRAGGDALGIPVLQLKRIVMVQRTQLEQLSAGWFVSIDGVPTRLHSIATHDHAAANGEYLFVLLPRGVDTSVGYVVDEVLGAEPIELQQLHPMPDWPFAFGAVVLHGQITPIIDLQRLHRNGNKTAIERAADSASKARILLVDDTQFFRDLVGGHLKAAGYEVITAEHGAIALEYLADRSFDLIVSDLEMPIMDGWALASAIRRDTSCKQLPLLALTTLAAEEAEATALASGFDAFEVKLEPASLLAAIERLLHARTNSGRLLGGST
jgi:two-component system chemotaxis sensor kinase CheA